MKKLILLALFTVGSCGSTSPFDSATLPVAEIAKRTTTIVQVMERADLDQDGVIKGSAEWYALGSGVAQLVVQWAMELNTDG